jgi:hypothetical protein
MNGQQSSQKNKAQVVARRAMEEESDRPSEAFILASKRSCSAGGGLMTTNCWTSAGKPRIFNSSGAVASMPPEYYYFAYA